MPFLDIGDTNPWAYASTCMSPLQTLLAPGNTMGHEPYLVFLSFSKNPTETIIVRCHTGRVPFVTLQHGRMGKPIYIRVPYTRVP